LPLLPHAERADGGHKDPKLAVRLVTDFSDHLRKLLRGRHHDDDDFCRGGRCESVDGMKTTCFCPGDHRFKNVYACDRVACLLDLQRHRQADRTDTDESELPLHDLRPHASQSLSWATIAAVEMP